MPINILVTIGTDVSRDFATISAFEVASSLDLVANDYFVVGICHNDSVFDEHPVFAGAVSDGTRYRVLTVNPADRHKGSSSPNNVRLIPSTNGHGIDVDEEYTIIEYLEISGLRDYNAIGIRMQQSWAVARYNLIHHYYEDSQNAKVGISMGGYQINATAFGNIIYRLTDGTSGAHGITGNHSQTMGQIINNTVFRCSYGTGSGSGIDWSGRRDNTGVRIFGNISMHSPTVDFGFQPLQQHDRNCSKDATATGPNSLINKVNNNIKWVNTADGTEDFRIQRTSQCKDVGEDITALFGSIRGSQALDFEGNFRPFSVGWDIGASEYTLKEISNLIGTGQPLKNLSGRNLV